MFEGLKFPKSLDESLFDSWMEAGRASPISYCYLLIFWDELEEKYLPGYALNRGEIAEHEKYGYSPAMQLLVAAYDLYSESRVG